MPKPNKQSKKGDKSKLKEIEQEEQLKLARSLINNLERKVNELENSNRILRRDVLYGGNQMHSNQGEPNEALNQIPIPLGTCNHSPIPPQSVMEQDFKKFKENIRSKELEQLKTRNAIQSIEILIHQKHSSGVPLLGGSPQHHYNSRTGVYGTSPNYIGHSPPQHPYNSQIGGYGPSPNYFVPSSPQHPYNSQTGGYRPSPNYFVPSPPQHPYNSQTGGYGPSANYTIPSPHLIPYRNPYAPMQSSHPSCQFVPMTGPRYLPRNAFGNPVGGPQGPQLYDPIHGTNLVYYPTYTNVHPVINRHQPVPQNIPRYGTTYTRPPQRMHTYAAGVTQNATNTNLRNQQNEDRLSSGNDAANVFNLDPDSPAMVTNRRNEDVYTDIQIELVENKKSESGHESSKQKPLRETTHTTTIDTPSDEYRPLHNEERPKKAVSEQIEHHSHQQSFLGLGRPPKKKWKRKRF